MENTDNSAKFLGVSVPASLLARLDGFVAEQRRLNPGLSKMVISRSSVVQVALSEHLPSAAADDFATGCK